MQHNRVGCAGLGKCLVGCPLDAKKNPAKYPELMVRGSGYSAYFTRLGRPIQDDIIARSELRP